MFKKTALFYVVIYIKNAIRGQLEEFLQTQPKTLNIYAETEEFLSKEAIKWNSK